LPTLFEVAEQDSDPMVRDRSVLAMSGLRPTPASIPVLIQKLRSSERAVRFRAADLLSRIGPKASEAVPALFPLLEEQFVPSTTYERKQPAWNDPAVAATWALRSIAPNTPKAQVARSALLSLLSVPDHPWRRAEVDEALRALEPTSNPVQAPNESDRSGSAGGAPWTAK
jgi:HEAT repeat protein